jgi:uncharacterized Rossmann fold enzyme
MNLVCEPIDFPSLFETPQEKLVREYQAEMGAVPTDITPEQLEERLALLMRLPLPSLADLADLYFGQRAVICGSGMSLNASDVADAQAAGARVFAINKSHDWLIERGVMPDFSVMLDPNLRVAGYQTPNRRVTYLLGASCDRAVWLRFLSAGIKPFMFFPIMTDTQHGTIAEKYPDANICCIAGGVTAGLRAINVASWMGFQSIELHGFDSCYAPGKDGSDKSGLYTVDKPSTHHDAQQVTFGSGATGKKFTCITNGSMRRQIISFKALLAMLPDSGVHGRVGQTRIRVAGDGAIPWMAWNDARANSYVSHVSPDAMAGKYGNAKHFNYFKGAPEDEPV